MATAGAISCAKLQSNHHHQQINTQFFYRSDALPVAQPSVKAALKGKISHSMDLLTQSSPGVFQLCLWPLVAPGYLGEGCHASHQPSWCQYPVTVMNSIWSICFWCWLSQVNLDGLRAVLNEPVVVIAGLYTGRLKRFCFTSTIRDAEYFFYYFTPRAPCSACIIKYT